LSTINYQETKKLDSVKLYIVKNFFLRARDDWKFLLEQQSRIKYLEKLPKKCNPLFH